MNRVAVFNPEHDMALANGNRYFIAPRNIREMACDLAPLLDVIDGDGVLVWGWDVAVKQHLLRLGVAEELLPTDTALATLRRCSERQSAHHLLRAFHADHPTGPYAGTSIIACDMEAVATYATQHGHIILKDPLSSSGKGLRHVNMGEGNNESSRQDALSSRSLSKVKNWANALISRHGYLTAEPYYDKMQDLAMEFCVSEGQCRFVGYSLFTTNHHGRYEGNLLMSDDEIEAQLSHYVPRKALHEVQAWVVGHFNRIIPAGWDTFCHPLYFGIDMMVVKVAANGQQTTDDRQSLKSGVDCQFALHPCVEINLRLNMGIIAHEVRRTLLAPGVEGTFHVTAFPSEEVACQFLREQTEKCPPVCREGKFVSGYHPLTPLHPHTRHHAYVICG